MQSHPQSHPQSALVSGLSVAAIILMGVAFFSPIWWVSLTAPNYPKEAFPDGIRLHFSFLGVGNGCTTLPKSSRAAQETTQADLGWRSEPATTAQGTEEKAESAGALDCVNEMNTINHYVGMRPIGVGAPVERLLSRYVIAMLGVMLVGFAIGPSKVRAVALGAGFFAIASWMFIDLFPLGRLDSFVATYVSDAGKYFREADRIKQWGETLAGVTTFISVALVLCMGIITFASWRWPRFQLVLGLVPAGLPAYFVIAYAAWLDFFGHTMHPWGAFTLKPFMPTVFGEGKVAQFSTHSFPHYGFGVLCAMTVCLVVAVVRRRAELNAGARP
jgi:hypothetical protein